MPGQTRSAETNPLAPAAARQAAHSECGAAGVIEKLGAVATLPFTVPFGRIEKQGQARAVELFDQLASMSARRFRSIFKESGNPSNETEFDAIDIEFFVVKEGIHY